MRSRSARSTSLMRRPVTCVEYGLTMSSARFTLTSMPRRTALVVPVPDAGAYYASEVAVPAHVTILFPFLDPEGVDEQEVVRVLSAFASFDFVLDRVER